MFADVLLTTFSDIRQCMGMGVRNTLLMLAGNILTWVHMHPSSMHAATLVAVVPLVGPSFTGEIPLQRHGHAALQLTQAGGGGAAAMDVAICLHYYSPYGVRGCWTCCLPLQRDLRAGHAYVVSQCLGSWITGHALILCTFCVWLIFVSWIVLHLSVSRIQKAVRAGRATPVFTWVMQQGWHVYCHSQSM